MLGARVPDKSSDQGVNKQELTPIASRGKSDDKGPRVDENVSKGGIPGGWPAAVVLIDVEPMTRDDVFWETEGVKSRKRKIGDSVCLRITICTTGIPTVISRSMVISRRFCPED